MRCDQMHLGVVWCHSLWTFLGIPGCFYYVKALLTLIRCWILTQGSYWGLQGGLCSHVLNISDESESDLVVCGTAPIALHVSLRSVPFGRVIYGKSSCCRYDYEPSGCWGHGLTQYTHNLSSPDTFYHTVGQRAMCYCPEAATEQRYCTLPGSALLFFFPKAHTKRRNVSQSNANVSFLAHL